MGVGVRVGVFLRALGWVDGCGYACGCVPPSVSVRMGGWVWLCVWVCSFERER